jgi:F0F1-type ATP synthase membrane subunit a
MHNSQHLMSLIILGHWEWGVFSLSECACAVSSVGHKQWPWAQYSFEWRATQGHSSCFTVLATYAVHPCIAFAAVETIIDINNAFRFFLTVMNEIVDSMCDKIFHEVSGMYKWLLLIALIIFTHRFDWRFRSVDNRGITRASDSV